MELKSLICCSDEATYSSQEGHGLWDCLASIWEYFVVPELNSEALYNSVLYLCSFLYCEQHLVIRVDKVFFFFCFIWKEKGNKNFYKSSLSPLNKATLFLLQKIWSNQLGYVDLLSFQQQYASSDKELWVVTI